MKRTAAEAVVILGKRDVKVTNEKDKKKPLPLLLKFEEALKAKKAIVLFWVEVLRALSLPPIHSQIGYSFDRSRGRPDLHCCPPWHAPQS